MLRYTRPMRGPRGCLANLVGLHVCGLAFVWIVTVVLNPWALHIGGSSMPLLYWHGSGVVSSKGGKTFPLQDFSAARLFRCMYRSGLGDQVDSAGEGAA